MKILELRNGIKMPQIGLGTWQITDRGVMNRIISEAYDTGYRLIDTAAAYSNEIAISKAISEAEIDRAELFISDKVWNTSRGYEAVQDACKRSLKKMKTDYFDLYLIHWPASGKLHSDWKEINADTWRGMEALYKEGTVRAVGVCNFKRSHLEELEKTAEILPFINQVEYHPGMIPKETEKYCKENRIQMEASSPLGNGQILFNKKLLEIAEKKGRSPAQICLRWEIQKGLIVIPKTSDPGRLKENVDIYDFELDEEEMGAIDNIPYCGGIGIDSEEVTEFG